MPVRRRRSRSSRATAGATAETSPCSIPTPSTPASTGASGSASCFSTTSSTRRSPCASAWSSSPATTSVRATPPRWFASSGSSRRRDARIKALSGGQKRRLDLAVALVGDPELLFLDEPTTGFDPGARRVAWDTIRSLRDLGKTILLTTHYIEEAQQLADRVAVLREGRIAALGTPSELIGTAPATEIRYRRNGEVVVVETEEPTRVLHELTAKALAEGVELEGLEVRRATLEEVYLTLTEESRVE